MSDDELLYSVADGVATVSLNRPEHRNALTAEMFAGVVERVRRAESDETVKAVVLNGKGRSFCAGYDLSDADEFYGGAEEAGPYHMVQVLRKRAESMRSLTYSLVNTVASVHSHCIGAGLYLVLACDMAIAADDAVFGFPEERQGPAGATWVYNVVAAQAGTKVANELFVTGRSFDAEEALRFGLVNRVVPRERLEEETAELVRAICSVTLDGLAVGLAWRHVAYDSMGVDRAFAPHYAIHPLAASIGHRPGEFDFRSAVRDEGLKAALAERERRFSGPFWGW